MNSSASPLFLPSQPTQQLQCCNSCHCAVPRVGCAFGIDAFFNCDCPPESKPHVFLNSQTLALHIEPAKAIMPRQSAQFSFTGLAWQCVEYARRFWLVHRRFLLPAVTSACDLFLVNKVTKHLNGRTTVLPCFGDLLIYGPNSNFEEFKHGHVAVIVEIGLNGTILVAENNATIEQNWANPDRFSRCLEWNLTTTGLYSIRDTSLPRLPILGWICCR